MMETPGASVRMRWMSPVNRDCISNPWAVPRKSLAADRVSQSCKVRKRATSPLSTLPIAPKLIVLLNLRKKRSGPLPQMAQKIVKVLSGFWSFDNLPMQPGQEFAFHGDMVRQFLMLHTILPIDMGHLHR